MTVTIIQAFEVVDVDEQDTEGAIITMPLVKALPQDQIEMAAVGDTGEPVAISLRFQIVNTTMLDGNAGEGSQQDNAQTKTKQQKRHRNFLLDSGVADARCMQRYQSCLLYTSPSPRDQA
eukprot:TRINITY_DN19659_c0_g1_i1.p3 TRINITY_DN19659_c0_g1~~TRINITY_DN19659_c0_g1_i1.p3  ORF type:complete len:120 (-),score=2.68 TRINITY_DN19659_c0_g1_i1:119-478(-)